MCVRFSRVEFVTSCCEFNIIAMVTPLSKVFSAKCIYVLAKAVTVQLETST